jgi:hypothetical protein
MALSKILQLYPEDVLAIVRAETVFVHLALGLQK